MGLFPAYVVDEVLDEEIEDEVDTPREFGVDFSTGQLTGKIVEGVEAIKVWCYFALQIARYRFFILSWEYGSEIEDLYGKGYSEEHIISEMRRMIEECLLTNTYIETVELSNEKYQNGKFSATISVTTIYGDSDSDSYETEVAA